MSWAVPKHKYDEVPNKDIKLETVSFSSDGEAEDSKLEEKGILETK